MIAYKKTSPQGNWSRPSKNGKDLPQFKKYLFFSGPNLTLTTLIMLSRLSAIFFSNLEISSSQYFHNVLNLRTLINLMCE